MDVLLNLIEKGRNLIVSARYVERSGIPTHYFREPAESLLSKELFAKLLKTIQFHLKSGSNAIFLTGCDSPAKDAFAACLLFLFAASDKTVRYMVASTIEDELPTAHAVVLSGVDLVKGLPTLRLKNFLKPQLVNGKIVILCGDSMDSIKEAIGESTYGYMSHISYEVKVESDPVEVPTL